jgi:hypothetical protein
LQPPDDHDLHSQAFFTDSPPNVLSGIDPGQYKIISLSHYACYEWDRNDGRKMVLAVLEKIGKRGRRSQPELYNLPFELIYYDDDGQSEISCQDGLILGVEKKYGFTFCSVYRSQRVDSSLPSLASTPRWISVEDFGEKEGFFLSTWRSIVGILTVEKRVSPLSEPISDPAEIISEAEDNPPDN